MQPWLDEALRQSSAETSSRDGFEWVSARARVVKELLVANAQPSARRERDGTTAMMFACEAGFTQVVREFLACTNTKEADCCNARNMHGQTALHFAAIRGHVDVVLALVQAKANCDVCTTRRQLTPCHEAAIRGHAHALKALVQAKADYNATTANGSTPCFNAAQAGAADAVGVLVDAKADVNRPRVEFGDTPCHKAAQEGFTDIVDQLLAAAADIDAVDFQGRTPCALAAAVGQPRSLAYLLRAKADVDLVGSPGGSGGGVGTGDGGAGWSPLVEAVARGYVDCARLLVEHSPRLCQVATPRSAVYMGRQIPAGSLPIGVASMLDQDEAVEMLAAHL